MGAINWNVVNGLTKTLYLLVLLCLFINPVYSTILLFAIVGIWSRIPGTATPVIGDWLLMLDLVDMFSLLVAINIGGIKGALFSIIVNLISGATGKHTNWYFVIKDMIAVSLTCLIIPYVHILSGNIVITMALYTLIRALWMFPLQIIMPLFDYYTFLGVMVVWTMGLYVINLIYAKIFGTFLDSLLKTGVNFNWGLFLIVSLIILTVLVYQKIKNNQILIKKPIQKNCYNMSLYRM